MAEYDFSKLESKYPEVVEQMTDTFDSHEFLRILAEQNQAEYIDALFAYRVSGNSAPFQVVHGLIMKKLCQHTDLVLLIRDDKPSIDIWGNSNTCAEWHKVK
jgi:hypothetical protein